MSGLGESSGVSEERQMAGSCGHEGGEEMSGGWDLEEPPKAHELKI